MNMLPMKSVFSTACALLAVLALSGCGRDIFATHNTPQDLQGDQHASGNTPPAHGAPATYASDGQDCNSRASSRLPMYDKPDTYPISDQERKDAYLSLYSECMRERNWQVAGPVRAPATVASNASEFAALSPAAGGKASRPTLVNAGNTQVTTSSIPGATVVVIGGNNATAAQLSSLSPSAGGATPANATVIMVQSPQAGATAAPSSYYVPAAGYAANASLPVAVPMPPPVASYTPPQQPRAFPPVSSATPSTAYMPAAPTAPRPAMLPATGQYAAAAQPSLAGAEANATGAVPLSGSPQSNHQLESILDQ